MSLDSILRNLGKNLFDINSKPTLTSKRSTYSISDTTVTFKSNNTTNHHFWYCIPIEIGKTYTVSVASIDWDGTSLGLFLSSTSFPDTSNYGIIIKTTLSKTFTAITDTLWVHGYISYGAGDFTFTFDKLQVEEGSTATSYEPYHQGPETVTIPYSGKNLIKFPYYDTTKTEKGITFTVGDDGSITVNGTATANTMFFLSGVAIYTIYKGTYTLSGCPSGGSNTTYCQVLGSSDYIDIGNGVTRTYSQDLKQNVFIKIFSGYTANNLVFKPQLEEGIQATDFSLNTGDKDVYKVSYGSKNLIDTSWAIYNGAVTKYPQFTNVSTDILSQVDKLPKGVPLIVSANISVTGSTAGYERNLVLVDQNNNKVSYYINDVGGTLQNEEIPTSFGKATYVYLYLGQNSTANISNLQIEIGSTATSYTPYSREQVWKSTSYNLLPNPTSATQTITGITFTNNSDGTITVNGTATANSTYNLGTFTIPTNYELKLSGCPSGGSESSYYLYTYDTTANKSYNDTGNGVTFTNTSGSINIYIRVQNEQTVDGLVFEPKLEFV